MADTNKMAPPTAAAPVQAEACPMCKKVHEESFKAAFERLKKGPRLLAKALRGMKKKTPDRSYAPGKWTIREIVCHLRDCELVYSGRYRKLVAEDNPTLMAFDQDRWADQTLYAKQDWQEAKATFDALRETNIEMLELVDSAARERRGTHAEYGTLTIDLLVRHIVEHDRNHIEQILKAREAKVKKLQPEKVS
jgi:hypothetical protein